MSTSSSSTSGIGFTGLLTIVFIVLRLTGYIDWSWWWVLSPIWISFIIGAAILVIIVGSFVVLDLRRRKNTRGRYRF